MLKEKKTTVRNSIVGVAAALMLTLGSAIPAGAVVDITHPGDGGGGGGAGPWPIKCIKYCPGPR
ncbi:hypothetical protein [Microbacterium galbinum]|uniref:hypothetical protein n=1 Tax=Microbacterium galbinum TaxID=2851646 RepID=UPI001FFCA03A|nr:hypothetical protein [Microbacterium galbinum]MCK2028299.1 hypothetical protein [Microbacterium galbinum]